MKRKSTYHHQSPEEIARMEDAKKRAKEARERYKKEVEKKVEDSLAFFSLQP